MSFESFSITTDITAAPTEAALLKPTPTKRGRKPIPKIQRRDRSVSTALTRIDYNRLVTLAVKNKMTVCAIARELLLKGIKGAIDE